MKTSLSWPNHLPKAHLPVPSHQWLGFQCMNLGMGGHTNFQTSVPSLKIAAKAIFVKHRYDPFTLDSSPIICRIKSNLFRVMLIYTDSIYGVPAVFKVPFWVRKRQWIKHPPLFPLQKSVPLSSLHSHKRREIIHDKATNRFIWCYKLLKIIEESLWSGEQLEILNRQSG